MTEPLSPERAQELRELISTLNFIFAKTLAHIPHEYMRRNDNEAAFQILGEAIRRHGAPGEFRGHRYRYLYLDEWKYWEIAALPDHQPGRQGRGITDPRALRSIFRSII